MKKITFIALLFFATLGLTAQSGEILYTDFEPDTMQYVTFDNTWYVDINYDNASDFKLSGYQAMHFFMPTIDMLNGFECCVVHEGTYLDSDTLVWVTHDDWYANGSSITTDPWDGNGYLLYGFRILIDNNYYYGWMYLWVNLRNPDINHMIHGRDIYIDKYAYCTIPNYPLRWGQTALNESVEENTCNQVAIYPNPTDGVLNISFSENTDCQSVEIYAVDGRLLKSQISNFETVNISSLNSGIYILKVNMADGREFTERIVKE